MTAVEVGQQAPDFALRDPYGQTVRLSDFRGIKVVVLLFFPLAFTPTCTGELRSVRDSASALGDIFDVEVLGVSCDSSASLRVFAEREGIDYLLLSDFWPHGEVSRAYGVFLEERGFANRGTFVIDREGMVRWTVVTSPSEARDPADLQRAVAVALSAQGPAQVF